MRDPTLDEMRTYLRKQHGREAEEFDVEEAIYWFAADYHGGQSSNLYSALSRSEFRPGRASHGPERGGHSEVMYADLVREFGGGGTRSNPPLPKPGDAIVGYGSSGGRIVNHKGRFTGWVEVRTVKTFDAGEAWQWEKAHAVVLEYHPSTRSRPYYAAGLSLGMGMLFRGEVVGYDLDEAKRQAIVEAEHWLEKDNEPTEGDE